MLPIRSLRVGAKAIVASIAMALVIFLLRIFNVFLILSVAMLVYLAVATLFGTIPREDIQTMYRAIKQRAQPGPLASQQEVELEAVSQ